MEERITGKLSDGTYFVRSGGLYGGSVGAYTTQARVPEMIAKLGKIEDFMEEQGFESLEDLKKTISNIEKLMLISSKITDIEQENQMLKNRWEKLKEFIKEDIKDDVWKNIYVIDFQTILLDEMQELEQGDKKWIEK